MNYVMSRTESHQWNADESCSPNNRLGIPAKTVRDLLTKLAERQGCTAIVHPNGELAKQL